MSDTFTQEYTQRLGVLTGAQLQLALDHFDLGRLQTTAKVEGGLFGQNVFLDTDQGCFVLRACPHGPDQFPREQFFCNQLHEKTDAPVPWPYRHETSPNIFGYEFVIMPRMPGERVVDEAIYKTLALETKEAIARACGEMLARMHALTWPHPGEFDFASRSVLPFKDPHDPRGIFAHALTELGAMPTKPTAADLAALEAFRRTADPALDSAYTATYVHHDFRESNSTAAMIGGRWQVTGVFDLMEGYFGRPEEDFARFICVHAKERPSLIPPFIAGYRAHRTLTNGWAERIRLFAVLDAILLWCYGQQHGWYKPENRLAQQIQPVLEIALA